MREIVLSYVGKSSFINDNEASFRRYRALHLEASHRYEYAFRMAYANVEGKKRIRSAIAFRSERSS